MILLLLLPLVPAGYNAKAQSQLGRMSVGFSDGSNISDRKVVMEGKQYTISFNITNYEQYNYIDLVRVFIDKDPLGPINSTPVNVVSAVSYMPILGGSSYWEHNISTIELDANYTVVEVYPGPFGVALNYGNWLILTLQFNTTETPGIYSINITTYEGNSYFDSAVLSLTVDAKPPQITLIYPEDAGGVYPIAKWDMSGLEVMSINYHIRDEYAPNSWANMSNVQLRVDSLSVILTDSETGTSYDLLQPIPYVSYELVSPPPGTYDYTTALLSYTIQYTLFGQVYPGVMTTGDIIHLSFNLVDEAGNSESQETNVTLDFEPPTTTLFDIVDSNLENLYFDGTNYWANLDDTNNGILVIVQANDNFGYVSSVTIQLGGASFQATYNSTTNLWTAYIPGNNLANDDLKASATDYAGNREAQKKISTLGLDTVAPIIHVSYGSNPLTPSPSVNWFSTPTTLTLAVAESGSGLNNTDSFMSYLIYGYYGSYTPILFGFYDSWTTFIVTEGYWEITFTLHDNAGNEGVYAYQVGVDQTQPIIHSTTPIQFNGTYDPATGTYYVSSNLTITIEWFDVSPVNIRVSAEDISGGTTLNNIYGASGLISGKSQASPAQHNLTVYLAESNYRITVSVSEDVNYLDAGQPRTSNSTPITVVFDHTNPYITGFYAGLLDLNKTMQGQQPSNTLYTIQFGSLSQLDANTGLQVIVDGTIVTSEAWTNLSTSDPTTPYYWGNALLVNLSTVTTVDVSSPGLHTVTINVSSSSSLTSSFTFTYYIDTRPPWATQPISVPAWASNQITLAGTITDDYNGSITGYPTILEIEVTVSGGDLSVPLTLYSNTTGYNRTTGLNLTALGALDTSMLTSGVTYQLTIKVADTYAVTLYEGFTNPNHTLISIHQFTVDTTPPEGVPAHPVPRWVNENPYLMILNLTDNGIGVNTSSIKVYIDGNAGTYNVSSLAGYGYKLSFNISGNGNHTINVTVKDLLGNTAEITLYAAIDIIPPQVNISITYVFQGAFTLRIQVSDSLSGITNNTYMLRITTPPAATCSLYPSTSHYYNKE